MLSVDNSQVSLVTAQCGDKIISVLSDYVLFSVESSPVGLITVQCGEIRSQ